MAAVGEVLRRLADDALGQLVAGQAAVAVLPAPLGRDHVRRVAGDQVERLAGDRLEEAAEPRLDVVDPVQRGTDLRERERTRVHVGRDHVIGVRRGQQRVRPVAGADVERALDRAARGQRGEPVSRRREAGHPARRVVLTAREAVERRGRAPRPARGARAARRASPSAVTSPMRSRASRPLRSESCGSIGGADRALQQEEADRRRDRRAGEAAFEDDRLREVGRRPVFAEQLLDRLGRVADGAQGIAERRRSVEVGVRVPGIHVRHPA